MIVVIVAEKPSVARDITEVVGARTRRKGFLEGGGYRVTWAVGHLVGLGQPHEQDERWAAWRADLLPMLPERYVLVPRDTGREQLDVVAQLLRSRETREVVCATDAGREGELIFRYIAEWSGCRRPCKRLWISSLTPDAIRAGLGSLKPLRHFDDLAAAARARSEADWLVGMNLSRAYTLATGEKRHVGRVKTPTLAMVVYRDLQIERFVPTPYREVILRVATEEGKSFECVYVRQTYDDEGKPEWQSRLPAQSVEDDREDAERVLDRAQRAALAVRKVESKDEAKPPPLLFDLTELQREANRRWGWTAKETLAVAQELYERHKLLSYPRTDSRHLSTAVEAEIGAVVRAVAGRYGEDVAEGTGQRRLSRRFVSDGKVTDHHAIIPTAKVAGAELDPKSRAGLLYDLVCRRLLQAWHEDAIIATTEVQVVAALGELGDVYRARGRMIKRQGWRVLEMPGSAAQREEVLLPGLRPGAPLSLQEGRVANKETRPPSRFTDATLLSAMEGAGASLEDELNEAMREKGLGTPATRAATIEELVAGGYLARKGKSIESTGVGRELVTVVDDRVASPRLTGELEAALRRIERGELPAASVLEQVRRDVAEVVRAALINGVVPRKHAGQGAGAGPRREGRRGQTGRRGGYGEARKSAAQARSRGVQSKQ